MTDITKQAAIAQRIQAMGAELSALAHDMRHAYSNYLPIDESEEEAFTTLSKGLTDVNRVLETNCHGLTPQAKLYEAKFLGLMRIPMITEERFISRLDMTKLSWADAKPVLPSAVRSYVVQEGEEKAPVHVKVRYQLQEKAGSSDPELTPEGNPKIAGYTIEIDKDGKTYQVKTDAHGHFKLPELSIANGAMIWPVDNSLAPAITKGNIVIVDLDIHHYDGDGTYCFQYDDHAPYPFDIAELNFIPSGGFSYISHRDHPEHIADTSTLNFLGKVVMVLKRTE